MYRQLRIVIAVIFLAASVVLLILGPEAHPVARCSEKAQIIPSLLSMTIGATAFWLVITLLFGRVYCSTVCPIGTLQDGPIRLRRAVKRLRRPCRYKPPKRWRYDVLVVYILCLLLGIAAVCYIVEPWNMMRNIASAANPKATAATWGHLSFGFAAGLAAGIVSLVLLLVWAYCSGRDFCNTVCPVGTALGLVSTQSVYHLEIDPDRCISCLKCEDVCRASCIKVVSRHVDNSRCVRCFDCLAQCPNDAIRFQINRNRRPASPLMRRSKKAGTP